MSIYVNNNQEIEKDYEIIPFGDKVIKKESKTYFNGVIKCSLKTKTPIFIGGKKNIIKIKIKNGEEANHNQSFFPENEKKKEYIIPASSLKGMIRAILDILTDSAVAESKVNKKEPEYKGKMPFKDEFIDKKFHSTNENKNLSIGESIFGATANSELKKADEFKNLQGKVYFTDGKINKSKATTCNEILLKALNSPKLKKVLNKEKNKILGRKYYKHYLKRSIIDFEDEGVKTKRNTTLNLINENNIFDFEVYFKNLAYHELSILVYSLKLEEDMYHKIGRGKALGMGSCKIEIKELKLIENEKKYNHFKSKKIYKKIKAENFFENAKIYLELNKKDEKGDYVRENIQKLLEILRG